MQPAVVLGRRSGDSRRQRRAAEITQHPCLSRAVEATPLEMAAVSCSRSAVKLIEVSRLLSQLSTIGKSQKKEGGGV